MNRDADYYASFLASVSISPHSVRCINSMKSLTQEEIVSASFDAIRSDYRRYCLPPSKDRTRTHQPRQLFSLTAASFEKTSCVARYEADLNAATSSQYSMRA